jgi:hypothetical protein
MSTIVLFEVYDSHAYTLQTQCCTACAGPGGYGIQLLTTYNTQKEPVQSQRTAKQASEYHPGRAMSLNRAAAALNNLIKAECTLSASSTPQAALNNLIKAECTPSASSTPQAAMVVPPGIVYRRRSCVFYVRPEAQCVGCNTRAFNHQITWLLLAAYMAGSNRLCSPAQAVCST